MSKVSDWSITPVVEWLFKDGRLIKNQSEFVAEFARQVTAQGSVLDRMQITFRTLNPQVLATAETWERESDEVTSFIAEHAVMETGRYIGSPMQQLRETLRTVHQSLIDLPADAHGAFQDLYQESYTDYYAFPVSFTQELFCAYICVTKDPDGFSKSDIENLKALRDYIAPILEVFSLRHTANSLMNTYVGRRTAQKVLSGMVKRGDADIINAALWFSDLRDFTQLTEELPAAEILATLNEYFQFVSEAISARGGEILRFIGDAMLIVFPIDKNTSAANACNEALAAALDAQSTLDEVNQQRRNNNQPQIQFGVGLNVGEVIYGNVGALDRLDFTVMGPAVNRTARLESLTKSLGTEILMSREFADLVEKPVRDMGKHMMKGVAIKQQVWALE
ncbi:MAG: adenylate/guanylate cyclase domain-containing protein [Pseudomonadota bacterium]